MSLILQGIDLPKEGTLTITIESNGDAYPRTIGASREHYQAIQIPKGHGRLIDGDALENTINYDLLHRDEEDEDYGFSTKSIWSYIDNAPTILEAEGESDV